MVIVGKSSIAPSSKKVLRNTPQQSVGMLIRKAYVVLRVDETKVMIYRSPSATSLRLPPVECGMSSQNMPQSFPSYLKFE